MEPVDRYHAHSHLAPPLASAPRQPPRHRLPAHQVTFALKTPARGPVASFSGLLELFRFFQHICPSVTK